MEIFDSTKSLLENVYYLSGILILITIIIGLIQLSIAKKTLQINSKRDAAALAAKQVEIYMTRVIPLHNKMFHFELKEKIERPEISIGEFTTEALIKKIGKEKLGMYHVGENHRGYLGSGHINFVEAFKGLKEIEYQGIITFESFSSEVVDPVLSNTLAVWRNLWNDSEDLAKKSLDFIVATARSDLSPPLEDGSDIPAIDAKPPNLDSIELPLFLDGSITTINALDLYLSGICKEK